MGKGLAQYRLRIFNAFGQKVFETNKLDGNGSPSEPWDGRYNGQPLPQDTYGWQIEARYINGTEWKGMQYPNSDKAVKAGFITIVR
jgi:gliding motility-associated-like protein